MSNANRESLGYIKEVTWGVNPGGNKQLLPLTQTSLAQQNNTQVSSNIRSDTNRTGLIRTGIETAGDISIEMQYGAYDEFIEGALRGVFATALAVTADTAIASASSDNSFNGTNKFTNALVGQWIKVSGFVGSTNNGWFKITSKPSASKIIVAGATLTTESAGPAITVKGAYLSNAATDRSFTIERQFTDITQFLTFTGLRVGELALTFGSQDIAKGQINFMGKGVTASGSSGFSGSVAALTNQSMNTVNNIKRIFINNIAYTGDVTKLDFTIKTNAVTRKVLGQLDAAEVRTGSIEVTGTLGEYIEDFGMINRVVNFTTFSLAVVIEDDAGNGYVFDFPTCKFSEGSPDNPGIDQDIEVSFNFTATLNDTYANTISVSRYPL